MKGMVRGAGIQVTGGYQLAKQAVVVLQFQSILPSAPTRTNYSLALNQHDALRWATTNRSVGLIRLININV